MSRFFRFSSLLFIGAMFHCQSDDYNNMLESLYNQTVPLIHTTELAKAMKNNAPILILDTRSDKEFQISHIKYAQLIDYDHFSQNDMSKISKDTNIVVYCSVGYRSEKIGEKLLELGYINVINLYGGIFQWKNDGYSVYNANNILTDSVHTYNKKWSKWLKNGISVY